MPENNVVGYYEGILDMYYAPITTDDSATSAPVYGTPAVLGKSIEVTISPRYREGALYASNAAVRREKRIDGYDVTLNVDQVIPSVRTVLLGRQKDSSGVEIIKGTQQAPYVAIGFAQTLDNGAQELWWIYKGKFSEGEKTAKTRGEEIEYQTPTLTGTFDRRIFDDALAAVVSTDEADLGASVVSDWFTEVYESPAATESP